MSPAVERSTGILLAAVMVSGILLLPPLQAAGTAPSPWENGATYPDHIYYQSCVQSSGYIYCVGGIANSTSVDDVYFAYLSSAGIGPWLNTTTYPTPIQSQACTAYSGYIYCVGGGYGSLGASFNTTESAYFAPISSIGVGKWTPTTSYPNSNAVPLSCDAYLAYIYCVGGTQSCGTGGEVCDLDTVYYASIGQSGIGNWTETSGYPALSDYPQSCAIFAAYIYCIGGGTAPSGSEQVAYAQISSTGVGAWQTEADYPISIEGEACATDSGFIYCLGGISGVFEPNQLTYYAAVSADGVGAWNQGADYPNTVSGNPSCVIYSGYIYCVGGNTVILPVDSSSAAYFAPLSQLTAPPTTTSASLSTSASSSKSAASSVESYGVAITLGPAAVIVACAFGMLWWRNRRKIIDAATKAKAAGART